MTPKKYQVLVERKLAGHIYALEGDFVYDQLGYDYGIADDDTRFTGIEHITVTLNRDGSSPGFTIPRKHLKQVAYS